LSSRGLTVDAMSSSNAAEELSSKVPVCVRERGSQFSISTYIYIYTYILDVTVFARFYIDYMHGILRLLVKQAHVDTHTHTFTDREGYQMLAIAVPQVSVFVLLY
jgi:hypothetical protein